MRRVEERLNHVGVDFPAQTLITRRDPHGNLTVHRKTVDGYDVTSRVDPADTVPRQETQAPDMVKRQREHLFDDAEILETVAGET